MGNEVFFEVWDKDRLSKDDLMGKVVHQYYQLHKKPNCNQKLQIKMNITINCKQLLQIKMINTIHWKHMLQASILLNPQLLSVADSGAFLCLPLSKK